MKHYSMNLIFSLALLLGFLNTSFAKIQTSRAFITRWNLATAGSGATQLSFGSATIGTVNYHWQEVSPGRATGSGSFSGSSLTITGLPTGAIWALHSLQMNINAIRQLGLVSNLIKNYSVSLNSSINHIR